MRLRIGHCISRPFTPINMAIKQIGIRNGCKMQRIAIIRFFGSSSNEMTEAQARRILQLQYQDRTIESPKQLRNKYYKLAKLCHPDIASPENRNPTRFGLLAEAYSLLSSNNKSVVRPPFQNVTMVNSTNHYWAKMFYGSIEVEVDVDDTIIESVKEAATLSRGGLDKGGLWEFVEKFNASLSASDANPCPHSNVRPTVDVQTSPAPYTRKRTKKTDGELF